MDPRVPSAIAEDLERASGIPKGPQSALRDSNGLQGFSRDPTRALRVLQGTLEGARHSYGTLVEPHIFSPEDPKRFRSVPGCSEKYLKSSRCQGQPDVLERSPMRPPWILGLEIPGSGGLLETSFKSKNSMRTANCGLMSSIYLKASCTSKCEVTLLVKTSKIELITFFSFNASFSRKLNLKIQR